MSFHSGVLITKQHSERNKNDERRHGPRGEETAFQGAVMSRRQPRLNRAQQVQDKEQEEADSFPIDLSEVLGKRADGRLKWLHRGLVFAGKKKLQITTIYDIATNKRFTEGVSTGIGRQMRQMLLANLHLFSSKQQRNLQSDTSMFHQYNPAIFQADAPDSDGSDGGSSASRTRKRRRESGDAGRHKRGSSPSPKMTGNGADASRASRVSRLVELLAANERPLRPPPLLTSKGYVSRYPYPLPDIVPGEDVRKYCFGTADDFLTEGDDASLAPGRT